MQVLTAALSNSRSPCWQMTMAFDALFDATTSISMSHVPKGLNFEQSSIGVQ
jgi:hypothetical protein